MVTDPDGDMLPEHDLTQSGVVTTPAETVLCSIRLISGGSVIGHFPTSRHAVWNDSPIRGRYVRVKLDDGG